MLDKIDRAVQFDDVTVPLHNDLLSGYAQQSSKNLHFAKDMEALTLRVLMSYIYIYIYIYMEHPFLMFLDHTQRRSTVGRTPLDE